jgi:hypothetical protein
MEQRFKYFDWPAHLSDLRSQSHQAYLEASEVQNKEDVSSYRAYKKHRSYLAELIRWIKLAWAAITTELIISH